MALAVAWVHPTKVLPDLAQTYPLQMCCLQACTQSWLHVAERSCCVASQQMLLLPLTSGYAKQDVVRISPDVRGARLGVRLLRSVLTLGALHLFRFGFAVGTAQVIADFAAKSCCAGLLCCCRS